MKVAHFARYAPNACGLYEAARDFVRLDVSAGYGAIFVDKGDREGKGRQPGAVDDRGGYRLVVQDYAAAKDADLFVCHDFPDSAWLMETKAPILFVFHGKPLDCFRPEQNAQKAGSRAACEPGAYSLLAQAARWPRTKKCLTMWQEHVEFWRPIIPEDKIACTGDPVIDQERFTPEGKTWKIPGELIGKWNVMIADSWRADTDIYEIFHGALIGCLRAGARLHLYGLELTTDQKCLPCWELLITYGQKLGLLGERWARVADMEERYRAMDLVVTANRSTSRILMEAMSCGCAVVGPTGNRHAQFTAHPQDAVEFGDAVCRAVNALKEGGRGLGGVVAKAAKAFGYETFGPKLHAIYKEIVR